MPTSHEWNGGAPVNARVMTVTVPDDIEAGMIIVAKIGFQELSYTVLASATATSVATAFVSLWNASTVPEFAEITAASGSVAGTFTLTADTAGKPFVVAFTMNNETNEKQTVTIGNSPTGGTFTLSYEGQTTAGIAPDAAASAVESALEALSTIGASNVVVTGDAGGPWTVEFVEDLAGTNVTLMGANPDNLTVAAETQEIDLGSPTGGTFTVQYGESGTPSAGIAYNASAATVKTALETLTEVAVDDIGVTGSAGGPYTLTFQGNFAGTNAESVIVNGTSLTGGLMDSVTITEQTAGGGGGNEAWTIREHYGEEARAYLTGNSSVSGGTFDMTVTLTPDGGSAGNFITLTDIPYDVTVSELQTLIDADTVAEGPRAVIVQAFIGSQDAGSKLSDGDTWLIRFTTSLGNQTVGVGSFATGSLTGGAYTFSIPTSSIILPETESRYTNNWFLLINGEATESISHNTTAADIIEKAEALSTVGAGNINVEFITTQNVISHGIRITFQNDLGNQETEFSVSMLVSGGPAFYIQTNWKGAAGTSEVQRISIAGSPGSGKFSVKFGTGYTQTIDYNQSASELEDILEAVSTIGVGNVTCSGGPFPDTAIDVTFTGGLGGTNVALMVENQGAVETTQQGGTAATVIVDTIQIPIVSSETIANSGPNCWDVAGNWSTNSVPVTGDTVYISESNVSILYGLDQSAVTLAALNVDQTFTGTIGLPRTNADGTTSYSEYRDQYLKIGATLLNIGDKSGVGSERIKINLGSVQSTVLITNSGDSPDGNTPAILLLGTHASNTININRGSLGVAYYPTEVATVATLRQAFFDNAADDTEVYLGTGVTVTDIVKSGGVLDINSATTSFKQTAGTTTVHAGAHTVLNILAGLLNYNSTGTLSAVNLSGDAVLVFDQDARPKDVTVIDKFTDESEIYDESGSIASPVIDLNKCGDLSTIHMGQDFKLTFGATS